MLALALVGLVGASLVVPAATPAAADEIANIACGAGYQTTGYIVPPNVHRITIDAFGEQGKDGADWVPNLGSRVGGGKGGLGAHVTVEQVRVEPGQTIYTGQIGGGTGVSGEAGVGSGGRGQWVAFGKPDANCDFSGVEFIAVAAGGGGGGGADANGSGGTGGAAGQAGNPGGDNQFTAGGGGGGGTSTSPGAGGAGAFTRSIFGPPPTFADRQAPGQTGGSLYDGIDPIRTSGYGAGHTSFGGDGSTDATFNITLNSGGGGGGGIYGGGGGAATGSDFIASRAGNGAGGGGGGGSFPDIADISLDSQYVGVQFTEIYDTTLSLTPYPSPVGAGEPLILTADLAVAENNPVPALGGGQLSFSDNGDPSYPGRQSVILGRVNVVGNLAGEQATLQLPDGLDRGIHQLSAFYSGYEGGTTIYSTIQEQFLNTHNAPVRTTYLLSVQGAQDVTFTTNPGPQEAYGATYRPQATSTFGLPVSFSIDPASASVCTISAGVVSFIGGGTCAILGDQPGDAITKAAPQARQELTVTGAIAQAITFTSTPPADLVFGDTYAPTATGGGSGNPVTFSTNGRFGSCKMTDGVFQVQYGESCLIRADQAGGNGFAPAPTVEQAITIAPTESESVITSTPPTDPQLGDTYTVTGYAHAADYISLPIFSLDAASQGCTAGTQFRVFTSRGVEAAITVTYTGIGTCIVNADWDGNPPMYEKAPTLQQRSGVAGAAQVITFTTDAPADAMYGGSAAVAADGGGSGNPVVLASTTPTVCTVDDATIAFVGAGSCTITADQAGDSTTWSAAPQVTRTFTVAPARLTVTAPTLSFIYGAAVAATVPAITGFVGSDTADALLELPSCDRDWVTEGAGSHDTTCSGGDAADYDFDYVGGTATITPATAVVTASSGTTGYGLAIPAVTATVTGLVNGDLALDTAPMCSSGASVGDPVGTYATTCTSGADADYVVQTVDGSVSVSAATLVISPAPLVRTYGDDPPTVLPEYVGLLDGDSVETPPTCTSDVDAQTDVGLHTSACAGAADPNYDIGYGAGTVQVTPAGLVVSASTATMYGSALPDLAPTYTGLAGGDAAPQTPAECSTVATSSSPVGAYSVACAGAVDSNYTITYGDGSVTVAPAPLTITASSPSVTAGSAIPAITAAYSGLVLGEVAPSNAPVCSTTATASSPAGSYPTVCADAADANYVISYAAGTVTITAAEVPAQPVPPVVPSVPSGPSLPGTSNTAPGASAPVTATPLPTPAPTTTPTPTTTAAPTPSADDDASAPSQTDDEPTAGPDLAWLWLVGFALIALLALAGVIVFRRRT